MKNMIAATLVSLLVASPAMAWNPLKDAAEQVKNDTLQQAEQVQTTQQANATAAGTDLTVEAKRKALGKKAKGKSDEEVNALYNEKVAKGQALVQQAKDVKADNGAALKAGAAEQAQAKKDEKVQEATQKGFDKLNKALGQ